MSACLLVRHQQRLCATLSRRRLATSARRQLLSGQFALDEHWARRHADLREFRLGSGYEWIASVQKKFIGDGRGSAVDVDAAACLADEQDQIEDVLDLVYKLRHTENTADLLESTEYAVYRLLLRYNDTEALFTILNDPVNYGVFMNEHCYSLAIDQLLKADNVVGAAIVATHVMKQEAFGHQLLNNLAAYALLRWLQLPAAERTLEPPKRADAEQAASGRVLEEEEYTFKVPWLRPETNDGHFDLVEPMHVVAKSLRWLGANIASDALKADVLAVTNALDAHNKRGAQEVAESASTKSADAEGEDTAPTEFAVDESLVSRVYESLSTELPTLEATATQIQQKQFDAWRDRRRALIAAQAQQLNIRLRLQELDAETARLNSEAELLTFFDKRVQWEDEAREKDELAAEYELDKAEEAETEDVYSKSMFEKAASRYAYKRTP